MTDEHPRRPHTDRGGNPLAIPLEGRCFIHPLLVTRPGTELAPASGGRAWAPIGHKEAGFVRAS